LVFLAALLVVRRFRAFLAMFTSYHH